MPGSPLDPRAAGCNALLKEGAILTTGVEDVLEALAPVSRIMPTDVPIIREPGDQGQPMSPPPDDSERARIVEALGPTPVEIDDIIRHTGLSPSAVYLVLLELDLAGRLHRHPGGLVSLAYE